MPDIDLKPRAKKFIESLSPKHKRQTKDSILALRQNPIPNDPKKLISYESYIRIDVGEYQVIYRYEVEENLVTVVLIGKRNDDAIYRIARRVIK